MIQAHNLCKTFQRITRLIDMGIKPFLVASSIQAVMAQRLIRVLHDGSKELAEPHSPFTLTNMPGIKRLCLDNKCLIGTFWLAFSRRRP